MNKDYVDGFMAKCASCGVDPEVLVKNAQVLGHIMPALKLLNPLNIFRGVKGLMRGIGHSGALRGDMAKRILSSPGGIPSNFAELNERINAALKAHPRMMGVRRRAVESAKQLGGGLAGTSLLGGTAMALRPSPEPENVQDKLQALLAQYLSR